MITVVNTVVAGHVVLVLWHLLLRRCSRNV